METEVLIRKRGADRIRRGHLWVYRSDIADAGDAAGGAIVSVREEHGSIIGKAFYSSKSQITLRFLARGSVTINDDFFRRRFAAARELRERLGVDPRLCRLISSEGDLLPGLVVDRYGDTLVAQSLIQSTAALEPLVTSILQEIYQPRTILYRNDSKVRELEGLPLVQNWIGEEPSDAIVIEEDGKFIEVPLRGGQKTGTYLDQRENHRAAKRYAHGRALDGFSYSGGFALQMAEGCENVEAVDLSETALRLARSNIERNKINNIQCIEANVFDYLRQQCAEGARYDTIVLDPPAFAKNRDSLEGALRGYKEINNRAMRILRDGGILITCSCSHHVSEGLFAEMLAEAARDAGCWVRVLERRLQASDHPVILTVPETLYLKCFILQIMH